MKLEDWIIDGKPAITETQKERLLKNDVFTVHQLLNMTIKDLQAIDGIGEKIAGELKVKARDQILGKQFMNIMEYEEWRRRRVKKITTGSKAVDMLIGGGISTLDVTGVWGENEAGKSQICMQLSCNVQLPVEQGGADGNAIYFDTEGNFNSDRVKMMADHLGLADWQRRIKLCQVFTSERQLEILDEPEFLRILESGNIKLIVVDSVICHFRSEYVGRDQLAERQQKLNQYIAGLHRLARTYNLAVVCISQAMSVPTLFGGERASGGNIFGHNCTPRLRIRHGKAGSRIVKMEKSPYLPVGEATFVITEHGIEDTEAFKKAQQKLEEEQKRKVQLKEEVKDE